ncbi:hypothetical protein GRAN_3124 [Granulicella sibirica]|uniref:Uncharacterized protein n=1 Tax=Granulicella sibirica TaxID=2479048 RepID=A0A4Q0SZF6_9BACT|nr:hypothetical protein GRAN_3124 [Granulicella sibirica]
MTWKLSCRRAVPGTSTASILHREWLSRATMPGPIFWWST